MQSRFRNILGGCIGMAVCSCVAPVGTYATAAPIVPVHIAVLEALPPQSRSIVADDVKLLIGWAADASSLKTQPEPHQVIDRGAAFSSVRSFSPPTDMRPMAGSYRVIEPPLTGPGYWGLALSVKHLHVDPARVPGLNFVKDEDPGVGPHALLTNRTGLQVYVHADGSGGLTPAGTPIVSAFANPRAHLLGSFFNVNLAKILAGIGALNGPDTVAP